MASDIAAVLLAFALFSLVGLVPGYVLGWGLDLLGFRSRSLAQRLVIAAPVSIAAFPVLTYLLWQWSVTTVWLLYGVCWIAFCVVMFHGWTRPDVSRQMVVLCAIVAGWVVVGMFCLIDLQLGDRLYFPTVAYDYQLRTAITSSITRSGIPPDNPYFFPGQAFTLRYHYFWLIPCSLVDQMGGAFVTARQAMIAGTLWCGIGLMAMVPLYLRFLGAKGTTNLESRTFFGIALLGVTGLDLVPTFVLSWLRGGVIESIEWWNHPIMAWTHAVLWVPHHVAGLVACLTGFLVVYYAQQSDARLFTRVAAALAGGLMFASSVGLSIYVSFVFAAALAIFVVLLMLKGHRSEAAPFVLSGVIAAAVSLPYLLSLSSGSGAGVGESAAGAVGSSAGTLFQLAVRPFRFPEAVVRAIWPEQLWLAPVSNLLLLPLNYFLELGFFSLVGIVMFNRLRRKARLDVPDLCALTMAVTSILICTFLRSSVIENNDLGWRGVLVAQFILLLWAAELWDDGFFTARARTGLIAGLLAVGAAGTVYEIAMVRFYTLISDDFAIPRDTWFPADHRLGGRTYGLRGLYEQLQERLPAHAVVQHNPNQPVGDVFHGLYADRQTAVETPGCGVVFGGDPHRCGEVMPSISALFDGHEASDWRRVDATCRELSIAALVAKDTDPVWKDPHSWVWTRQPLIANQRARAVLCGSNVEHSQGRAPATSLQ